MKKIFKYLALAAVVAASLMLGSCHGQSDESDDVVPDGVLRIFADKSEIVANGSDVVNFRIMFGQEDVSTAKTLQLVRAYEGKETYMQYGISTFSSVVAATYTFRAEFFRDGVKHKSDNYVTVTVVPAQSGGTQALYVQRILGLQFTSTGCVNCPTLSTNLKVVKDQLPGPIALSVVSFHQNFNNVDDMTHPMTAAYYKQIKRQGLPQFNANLIIDDDYITVSGLGEIVEILELVQQEYPATCGVAVESSPVEGGKTTITAKVTSNIPATYRYQIFLVEDKVMDVQESDFSQLLANGYKFPETFTVKAADGVTDLYGVMYKPFDFDPNKKYPIIEYIYAGPGSHYVPKSFSTYNHNMTALAELGFIVVQLDGMGTSFRSKEFEDVCYKNLKDAGFPDRKAWIRAAAEKYPYMDIDRVGIFGASAGGQESTTAVLLHPEFYKAAYSSCGCHDNRMDKIWWNEQWLGYPIGDQYKEGSNVENAHLLSRPLMLVVGELDDNVDPASTMQVVDALIRANKDFELVVLPGVGHTMGESYGEHKRYDFFVRNLMGVNPPKWEDVK